MKIGQKPELSTAALQAAAAASKQAVKTSGPAAEEATKSAQVATSSAGVPVSFSSSAKALDPGRAATEFDADRVKAMREAIANGSFRVSAEAIADKLLANTSEILAHSMAARAA